MRLRGKIKRLLTGKSEVWVYITLVTLIYLLLASGKFFLLLPEAGHDDGLLLKISKALSSGDWLGSYNNLTLAKGISYPLWTALAHTVDVPLWLANSVLYIIACLAIAFALRSLIKRKELLIAFYVLILFNPAITPRAYRDSIAPAIIMIVLAWVIGLFVTIQKLETAKQAKSVKNTEKEFLVYTLFGLFALPFWWYLREDYFWLLPFVVTALLFTIIIALKRFKHKELNVRQIFIVTMAVTLPFVLTFIAGYGIATCNKNAYGRFVINDYTSKDFTGAYGALTRIRDDDKSVTVPVSEEMREKAYGVSPTFSQLKECLDSVDEGECEFFKNNSRVKGEYEGGWFFWALRWGVQEEGYYKNAQSAEGFYDKLSDEINQACDNGQLDCAYGERASLSPPYNQRIINPIMERIPTAIAYVASFKGVENLNKWDYPARSSDKDAMADYLGVRYSSGQRNIGVKAKQKTNLLIIRIYQLLNPVLLIMSAGTLLWLTVRIRNYIDRYGREVLVGWGLFMLFLLRAVMISYVDVTSFPAIDALYFSSLYPVMFIFEGLLVSIFINILFDKRKQQSNAAQQLKPKITAKKA